MLNEEYASLWDVIFERHPKGAYYRGRYEQAGTTMPSKSLLQDLFAEQRTALILDELQSWFDALHDEPGDHGPKRRQWAFNFIQILSELAKDRPDLLCLVISVRDSSTEAFRQILRVGPNLIDFKGETAREDRKRLLLHQRCHHLIHLELPFNPNRLEQRNGRIDRYGQQHQPIVRYRRPPKSCLARFDELKQLGRDKFTRKYDPYWDIPLNENVPQPVIDLPFPGGDGTPAWTPQAADQEPAADHGEFRLSSSPKKSRRGHGRK